MGKVVCQCGVDLFMRYNPTDNEFDLVHDNIVVAWISANEFKSGNTEYISQNLIEQATDHVQRGLRLRDSFSVPKIEAASCGLDFIRNGDY